MDNKEDNMIDCSQHPGSAKNPRLQRRKAPPMPSLDQVLQNNISQPTQKTDSPEVPLPSEPKKPSESKDIASAEDFVTTVITLNTEPEEDIPTELPNIDDTTKALDDILASIDSVAEETKVLDIDLTSADNKDGDKDKDGEDDETEGDKDGETRFVPVKLAVEETSSEDEENSDSDEESSEDEEPKKKKKWIKITLISIAAVFLVCLITLGILAWNLANKFDTFSPGDGNEYTELDDDYAYVPIGVPQITFEDKDVTNILLLGCDSRTNWGVGNSDVIMILSINSRTKTLSLISILRDTYVEIPGVGKRKINAAYASGGSELTKQTIENNFRITIDGWFATDFKNFEKIIDDMGGIDMPLTAKEASFINTWSHSSSSVAAGNSVRLDGLQALTYCRNRYDVGSDWGRTSRQRKLVTRVIGTYKTLNIVDMYTILEDFLPYVQTSYTNTDIIGYCAKGIIMMGYDIKQISVPAEGEYTEDRNYNLHLNYDVVLERMHNFMTSPNTADTGKDPVVSAPQEETITDISGEGEVWYPPRNVNHK